jgi:integrase
MLLRAIDGYEGEPTTKLVLKITPHFFARLGELRKAEWSEFDFDKSIWFISVSKMKMRVPHRVPLSRQVRELLHQVRAIAGNRRYLFSPQYHLNRPMSENTINGSLRRLGYSKEEMTAHGFRSTASTLLDESGQWNPDAIERALAHNISNSVRGTYHHGAHWEDRVKMA